MLAQFWLVISCGHKSIMDDKWAQNAENFVEIKGMVSCYVHYSTRMEALAVVMS